MGDMTDTDALDRFLTGETNTFCTAPQSNEPALAKAEGSRHPIRTRVAELRRGAGSRRLLHIGFAVALAAGGGLGLVVVWPGVRPTVPSLTAPPIAAERPGSAVTSDPAPSAGNTDTAPGAPGPSIAGPDGEATPRAAMARWYGERRPPITPEAILLCPTGRRIDHDRIGELLHHRGLPMHFRLPASDVRHHWAQPARRPAIEVGFFRAVVLQVNLLRATNGSTLMWCSCLPI